MRRAFAVMAVLLVAACGRSTFDRLPEVDRSDTAETTTTVGVDYSKVPLATVPGETTTTIDNSPGKATLSGTAVGPDGPMTAGTVRLERLVGDQVVVRDVAITPEGTWSLERIKGGRYRVRAWRAPDLAQVEPELLLLRGDETRRLDLRVQAFRGLEVTSAVAPSPPVVEEPANLVVRAANRMVDDQGIVRAQPMVGTEIELFGQGDWALRSANPAVTDAAGQVQFEVTCRSEGPNPLSVVVNGADVRELALPPCAAPPPTTTTSSTTF